MGNCIPAAFEVINIIPASLPIYFREYTNAMYAPSAYFLSITIASLPLHIIQPCFFATVSYWMIGFGDDITRYFEFMLVIILVVLAAYSLGYLISTMGGTYALANAMTAPIVLPLVLFAGFFVNINSIPLIFVPICYLSFFKYSFEALAVIIWKDVPLGCFPDETCYYEDGNSVLAYYSLNPSNLGFDIAMLIVMIVVLRGLSFFFLQRRSLKVRASELKLED